LRPTEFLIIDFGRRISSSINKIERERELAAEIRYYRQALHLQEV